MKTNFTQSLNWFLRRKIRHVLSAVVFVFVAMAAQAATKTWTGAVSTDWSTAGNWSPSGVPASGDDVLIPGGLTYYPVMSSTLGVKTIKINTSGSGASFTVASGTNLTMIGMITVYASGTFNMNGGNVNIAGMDVYGTVNMSGGTIESDVNIDNFSGAVFNQSGGLIHMASSTGSNPTDNFILQSGATMNQTGGTLYIKDYTTSPGTFNQNGSTAVYKIYHDWKPGTGSVFNSTSGTVEFAGSGGGGTFPGSTTSSNTQFSSIQINSGVDPAFGTNAISSFNVSGDWINNSSVVDLTSKATTVIFNGSGAQTIGGTNVTNFNNVTINKSAGIASLAINTTVKGDLTISSGTLNLATYTCNRTTAGGTLSVASGATMQLGGNSGGQTGSNFPTNYTTLTLSSGSIVEYSGDNSVTQTIYATPTYSKLTLTNGSGSGSANKITTANITVNSTLTINSGAVLSPGAAFTVTGTGTLTGFGTAKVTRTSATADFLTQYPITNKTYTNLIVNYTNAAQTINLVSYGHLTLDVGFTISGNLSVGKTLTLVSGSLDMSGKRVTIGGISGSGLLKGSTTSGLVVSGAGTVGTLYFEQTTDGSTNALDSIRVTSGTVTLGNKLNVYNTLAVSGGTLNLNAQNLVLRSTASNTASVAPITGTLTGATNVTVERYIGNDGRKYRILTPGVTTTSSIRDNWMEGGMVTTVGGTSNPNPGYGTHITGSGGNTNGFDVTQTNNPSLFTYNSTTNSWVAVANTSATMNANQPYLIYVRGDRSQNINLSGSTGLPSSGTILRATGTLNSGNQTYSSLEGNGGYSLVANPFGSAVDWSGIYGDGSHSTNFQNTYTYWDPKVGTRGAYVTVTNSGIKSNVSSNATTDVPTAMGFFVQSKNGASSPSLTIKETHKSGRGRNNVNVLRTTSNLKQFNTSLYFYDAANTRINADGVTTVFDKIYSTGIDENDAQQISNWDEDIALKRGGMSLSIETRPEITDKDTLFLAVARLKVKQYEWQFDPQNLNAAGLTATLVDSYLNTQTPVSLSEPTYIPFTVTTDPASSQSNRFYIAFRAASVLPVKLASFSGRKLNSSNELKWTTRTEENFDHFELEYSTDQSDFSKIVSVQAKGGTTTNNYSFAHNNPAANSYYRLKMVDRDGSFAYSNVVAIRNSDVQLIVNQVYPNPFVDELCLTLNSITDTTVTVVLFDMQGKEIRKIPTVVNSGSNKVMINNLSILAPGTYMVSVRGEAFEFTTQVLKARD